MALADTLAALGFTADTEAKTAAEDIAKQQGLSTGGAYTVMAVYTKGDMVIKVEQNDSPEDFGGLDAVVKHPAVAIMSSPKGAVAFNPDDDELAKSLVSDLS